VTILFAGDPHGNFSPIIRACLVEAPGTLVVVGDLDCPRPVTDVFAAVLDAGWRLRWILGNHDCETESSYDNLVGAHASGDLGFRVEEADGVRIAGLPGMFKPSIWYPRSDDGSGRIDPPRHRNTASFLAAPGIVPWRGGLPLWHRDSIFPDDLDRLAALRFDILVTHEAPSSHRHGFSAIDDVAAVGGARVIVHGHHHESYSAVTAGGIAVRGLGLSETWKLDL
jgi:hypothetical protein